MSELQIPTPDQVRAARLAAGLKQRECAVLFGYALRSWQQKEDPGSGNRALSLGEWHFLLLLAGQHPDYIFSKREKNETE